MNAVLRRTQLVECQVTSTPNTGGGSEYTFPDQPNLDRSEGAVIYGISCYSAAQLAVSPQYGTAVIAQNDLADAVLVLQNYGSDDVIDHIPLYELVPALNGGFIRLLNDIQVNWTRSRVLIPNGSTSIALNEVFAFNVLYYYDDKRKR